MESISFLTTEGSSPHDTVAEGNSSHDTVAEGNSQHDTVAEVLPTLVHWSHS